MGGCPSWVRIRSYCRLQQLLQRQSVSCCTSKCSQIVGGVLVGLIWRTGREEVVVVVASVHFEYCLCNELEKRIFQGLEMYLRFRLLQGKVLLSHMHSSCDDVVKVPSFMKQNSICTTTSFLFIALQDFICTLIRI